MDQAVSPRISGATGAQNMCVEMNWGLPQFLQFALPASAISSHLLCAGDATHGWG